MNYEAATPAERIEAVVRAAQLADRRARVTGKAQFVVSSPEGPCVVGAGETTPANEASAVYVAVPVE